jgi:hypothetical protein
MVAATTADAEAGAADVIEPVRVFKSKAPDPEANPFAGKVFELDGVIFRMEGRIGLLESAALASHATEALDTASPAGMAAIWDFMVAALGDQETRRLRVHCRTHGTDDETMLDLITMLREIADEGVRRAFNRPTQRSSQRSGGHEDLEPAIARRMSLAGGDVEISELPAGHGGGGQAPVPPRPKSTAARRRATTAARSKTAQSKSGASPAPGG